MPNAEKLAWEVLKWIICIVVLLIVLGSIFWILFYSSFIANFSPVISLRNFYQNSFWTVEGVFAKPVRSNPPFDPLYTISVVGYKDGQYIYRFSGTLLDADPLNLLLTMQGLDGNSYIFRITKNLIDDQNSSLYLLGYVNIGKGALLEINWSDTRTLSQILSAHSKDPRTLVNIGNQIYLYYHPPLPNSTTGH